MGLFLNHVDLYIEFTYHCFNILRLSIFPLIIYGFVCYYGPSVFNMLEINSEELLKILKSAGTLVDELIKKHPLKTKIGGGILGITTLTTAGSVAYGSKVKDEVAGATQSPLAAALIKKLSEKECLKNDECVSLARDMLKMFSSAAQSPMDIAINDMEARINGDPVLVKHMNYLLDRLTLVHKDVVRNEIDQKNSEILKILANSANTSEVPDDMAGPSQISALSKNTDINSPVEIFDFWSLF